MRPIPVSLRNKLSKLKFYDYCCICNKLGTQWHHNLTWQGRQENEEFCILPLCPKCHSQANNKIFKEKLDWIMWNRAYDDQITFYSKAINYHHELTRLNTIFNGPWINPIKEE